MVNKLELDTSADGSTKSTVADGSRSEFRTAQANLLKDFTPQNVSYFKKYASFMSRNAVNPLEANELVTKVIQPVLLSIFKLNIEL